MFKKNNILTITYSHISLKYYIPAKKKFGNLNCGLKEFLFSGDHLYFLKCGGENTDNPALYHCTLYHCTVLWQFYLLLNSHKHLFKIYFNILIAFCVVHRRASPERFHLHICLSLGNCSEYCLDKSKRILCWDPGLLGGCSCEWYSIANCKVKAEFKISSLKLKISFLAQRYLKPLIINQNI